MLIGVLALQGNFDLHSTILKSININSMLVKTKAELNLCDGLIIPGGESSVISKLIKKNDLYHNIINFSKIKSIFGTCAGMILMSKDCNSKKVDTLNILDISVERNAWGRQIDSFNADVNINNNNFNAIFIRAPKIISCGSSIEILAEINNEAILVSNGNHLASSFHPELTNNTAIHKIFINQIRRNEIN